MICHILLISLVSVTGEIEILPNAANDSTPFVVRVNAQGLNPDSTYKIQLYAYGGSHCDISQRWVEDDWHGGYYSTFLQPQSTEWSGWIPIRIIKDPNPDYSYYIKYVVKDSSGEHLLVADTVYNTEGFKILDMTIDGGWLIGTVFSDFNLTTPLQNTIVIAYSGLAKSGSEVVGTYITEDNQITESYPLNLGQFRVAVPTGTISSLSFTSRDGESITGYTETSAPWTISAGKITYIDSFTIKQTLSLDISPNPFSPKESDKKVTYISYKLPYNEAYVSLYIYDRRGRRVRKLIDGDLSSSSLITIWDGKNDNGDILPMGIYIVYLQAEDKSSNKVETKKAEVVIAKRL